CTRAKAYNNIWNSLDVW
nr:immunoglobulin heavy chain junction region [Macaca mulatta]MOY21234.1 immunoglobulin heavy chain junction region [Macaca mulatta]MOY21602.1 immunoglobulin heavy chain junction region [Macaca mulatta]MOY21843.1 immunoglobulin heavy chain junction region [Macaca mulatta]MOY21898.1 immunoglobulin heavy chain junction region [Macaca mulatta]